MGDNRSFLSRWSQRKLEQQSTSPSEVQPLSQPEIDPCEVGAVVPDDLADDPIGEEACVLTDEDMPALETLHEGSDFSQFFSNGVSDELRDLALQRLFRLPEFNLRDGLNDYDEDFSRMTALSEAVVSQLRTWVTEKEEVIRDEICDSVMAPNGEGTEAVEDQAQSTADSDAWGDADPDDLGDADLEG